MSLVLSWVLVPSRFTRRLLRRSIAGQVEHPRSLRADEHPEPVVDASPESGEVRERGRHAGRSPLASGPPLADRLAHDGWPSVCGETGRGCDRGFDWVAVADADLGDDCTCDPVGLSG